MSCCHVAVHQEVRPGTARVRVTELSGPGQVNPTPAMKQREETEMQLYLSPDRLESLCGTRDLCHITSLELCVDTQENTLGNFGTYLPNLMKLKMNNSSITSVRDLGTSLSHLQVLWMSRCSLQELDGICTFTSLKELYVAYNNVSDLSQVGMLENLQLLDLEGNDVDDLVQIQFLGLCDKLQTLTLEGNPVCVHPNPTATQMADYSYRAAVRELVPQLRHLDDLRMEEDGPSCSSTVGEDWTILRNSVKRCNSSWTATDERPVDTLCPGSRPGSATRPASSLSCVRTVSSSGSRPHTGSRPVSGTRPGLLSPPRSRPGSADSDLAAVESESSALTHGAGKIVFCGNPVNAIRARREKLKTAPTRSTFTPRDLPIHVPEHTYDLEEVDVRERSDVFAELRAWREQHSRRLQAIEAERLPNVLTIHHSDEEEEEDDEEEGYGGVSDEEHGAEKHDARGDTSSPDSSCQSLSPELHDREALSPEVARLSLSPSPPPPLSATLTTVHHKPPGVRARRLRLQTNSDHILDFSHIQQSLGTGATDQRLTRTNGPVLPPPAHQPCPPPTKPLRKGVMDSCAQIDSSSRRSGHKLLPTPQTSKLVDRSAITRPHTARAALQTHHQHHIQQPCRGGSHPD